MKNKFQTVQPWISFILNAIKKEIRMDHLASSPGFARLHFGNRPLNRLTTEEIFVVYEKELLAENGDLAEWVVNRWVFKHADIYKHFAEKLSRINPEFSAIEALDLAQSEQVLEGACESFGSLPVYLFSFLNGVVFPEEIFTRLHHAAIQEENQKKVEKKEQDERQSLSEIIARQQKELFSMQQKYENKVAGLMKKYTVDVEALKKQVRSLQHQLNAVKASV